MDGAVLGALRTCTIDGCEKPLKSRGWCSMHHRRWWLTGDPGPAGTLRAPGEITPCSVEGCERLKRSSGAEHCEMHYARQRRTGDVGPAATKYPDELGTCTAPACDNPKRSRGVDYCGLHYERLRRTGTFDAPKPFVPTPCSVEDCKRKSDELGMCKLHATRVRRHGDPHVFIVPAERNMPRRERSHAWTGDQATYAAVHQRLRKWQGSARGYPCVDCDQPARQWSYDHADPDGRIDEGLGLPYSTDLDHYDPRCVPCHKKHDLALIAAKRVAS